MKGIYHILIGLVLVLGIRRGRVPTRIHVLCVLDDNDFAGEAIRMLQDAPDEAFQHIGVGREPPPSVAISLASPLVVDFDDHDVVCAQDAAGVSGRAIEVVPLRFHRVDQSVHAAVAQSIGCRVAGSRSRQRAAIKAARRYGNVRHDEDVRHGGRAGPAGQGGQAGIDGRKRRLAPAEGGGEENRQGEQSAAGQDDTPPEEARELGRSQDRHRIAHKSGTADECRALAGIDQPARIRAASQEQPGQGSQSGDPKRLV